MEKLVANQSTYTLVPLPSLKDKLMWLGEKHERRSWVLSSWLWKVIEKFILSLSHQLSSLQMPFLKEEQNTDWNCNQNRTCRKEGDLLIFLVADKGLKTNSYRVIDLMLEARI